MKKRLRYLVRSAAQHNENFQMIAKAFATELESIQSLERISTRTKPVWAKKKNAAALAMVRQRLKKISPERRREIAQKAAAARWGAREGKNAK